MKIYEFIQQHRNVYPINALTEALEVSTSAFHAWVDRPPSDRTRRREELTTAVHEAFKANHEIYGSRKVVSELADEGIEVCRNTVARIMREQQLRSRAQKRRYVVTTDSDHQEPVAENQLKRDFSATAINQKWVADITYIPTASGFVYLAAVMDLYSRRIVGWSLSDSLDVDFVLAALHRAIETRQPSAGLVHHSDRGCQYASGRHRLLLADHGIDCSMSRRGNCWDNAPMERFMCSLKNEWTKHHRYDSLEEVRASVFKYIDVFYNRRRRHQELGYVSPVQFEERSHNAAA